MAMLIHSKYQITADKQAATSQYYKPAIKPSKELALSQCYQYTTSQFN
jgi:hypothetical protein